MTMSQWSALIYCVYVRRLTLTNVVGLHNHEISNLVFSWGLMAGWRQKVILYLGYCKCNFSVQINITYEGILKCLRSIPHVLELLHQWNFIVRIHFG